MASTTAGLPGVPLLFTEACRPHGQDRTSSRFGVIRHTQGLVTVTTMGQIQRDILAQLGIDPPPRIYQLTPAGP